MPAPALPVEALSQAFADALARLLDPGVWLVRLIAQGGETVVRVLDSLIFVTADPIGAGRPFIGVGPVATLVRPVQVVSNAALVAVLSWGFFRIMWAHGFRNQHTLRYLLPRACLAVVLINFAPQLVQAAIDANNALCTTVVRLTAVHDLASARTAFAFDPAAPFLAQLTVFALFAGYAALALVYVIRFALLVVLTILAPAAALLFVLPETHRYARSWSSLFTGALLMQPLQLLVLGIGFSLDSYASWSTIGVPLRHLYALAAVYLAFKVPGALNSASKVGTKMASQARRETQHAITLAVKALAKP